MKFLFYIYILYIPFIHSFLIKSLYNYRDFCKRKNQINDYREFYKFLNNTNNTSINNIHDYTKYLKNE